MPAPSTRHAELDTLIDTAIVGAAIVAQEESIDKDRERYRIQEDVRILGAGGGTIFAINVVVGLYM